MASENGSNQGTDGVFFDGKSATEIPVCVAFEPENLVIRYEDGSDIRLWSYEGLMAVEPLGPNRPTRIYHSYSPDARLNVLDEGFRGILESRAPQLQKRTVNRTATNVVLGSLAFLVLSFFGVYAFLTYVPQVVAQRVPDSAWEAFGESVEAAIVGNEKRCAEPAGQRALDALADKFVEGGNFSKQPRLRVYEMSIVNAFAVAGGGVVISSKLIKHNKSPDEFAGVLAHELAHVHNKHPEEALTRVFGLEFIFSLLFGSSSGLGEFAASLGSYTTLMSYSREAEREADQDGQQFLNHAKINPEGLAGFFRSMEKKEKEQTADAKNTSKNTPQKSGWLDMLSSHPGMDERISSMKADPNIAYRPALSPAEWSALKAICAN